MNDKKEHFQEVLTSFSTAMLTTLGEDRIPRARPMQVSNVDGDNKVWFFTRLGSEKVDEIQADSTVGITMQGGGKFLSLSGKASVVRDQDKINQLWKEPYQVWFPEGKESPNVTLLVIDPANGEYWDTSGFTGLRYLYEAGKSYFQGSGVDTSGLDINAKVSL